MKVLVTGATGVIGKRLVPLLVQAGHSVTAAARTKEKAAALDQIGAKGRVIDLFSADGVQRDTEGMDAIINLATSIPPSSRAFVPGAWRENNRVRSVVSSILVDAAIAGGAKYFIQESFAPIYADGGNGWLDENAPIKPANYNRAVVDAEKAAKRFSTAGRTGIVLRFGYFYGPDSGFTLDAIGWLRKSWAPVLGSSEGYISSVSHQDAAAAVFHALEAPEGIYNVVDDVPVTRKEYYQSLASAIGAPSPKFPSPWLRRLAGSLGETLARSQRITNKKLRGETSWIPTYPSVREGWNMVSESLH